MRQESETIKEKMLLLEILQSIAKNESFEIIAAQCARLVKNPVIFLSSHLNIIAQSDILRPEYTAHLSSMNLEQFTSLFSKKEQIITDSRLVFYKHQLYQKITFSGRTCGYLCFLEYRHAFSEQALEYANTISLAVSGKLYQSSLNGGTNCSLQNLLTGLIQAAPKQPEQAKELLFANGWKKAEKYYLLVIDCNYNSLTANQYSHLKNALSSFLYEYEHYYFTIINCKKGYNLAPGHFPDLITCLKQYHLRAGVSHGFFDISELSLAFHQCIKSIEFSAHYNYEPSIYMYQDYIVTHLLEIMDKHTSLPVISLCHPVILEIIEYDAKHKTDYLNILNAYLFTNLSKRQAANVLNIHPNTMYNRLNDLSNIFNLHFENLGINANLLISMTVLDYLGIADAEIWNQIFK